MKRTVPLLITAVVGLVLIVASFIPATIQWGEKAAVWFDILAAIAFVLGGGNLLKTHLQKISDTRPGWGYSAITVIAFLVTLVVGLWKFGAPPAENQEFYGETFTPLALEDLPESQTTRIEGEIPQLKIEEPLPASVRKQLSEADGQLVFRGWMNDNQKEDLLAFSGPLKWKSRVEALADAAQPPKDLKGKILYRSDHSALSFKGAMTEKQRDELLGLGEGAPWKDAVSDLFTRSTTKATLQPESIPPTFTIPKSLKDTLTRDEDTLTLTGPMSTKQRDDLADQFPRMRPRNAAHWSRFRSELEAAGGPLNKQQTQVFDKLEAGIYSAEQLRQAVADAGKGEEKKKTATELYQEMQGTQFSFPARAQKSGEPVAIKADIELNPMKPKTPDVLLNEQQNALLNRFADGDFADAAELIKELKAAGPLNDNQVSAVNSFIKQAPTIGEWNQQLYLVLIKAGPIAEEQKTFLLADARAELAWQKSVGALFALAHQTKYRWSGEYRAEGAPFWWIYEYLFKPLTATMFAMLAFYVASAAFRAFRAKNLEAILLLGTAFIILLGRTSAGDWITGWMPEDFGLRIENLTVTIMSVFNTAGNRAIMIGIALGIASTSLKVLLGVDRSYLGSSD